MLFNETERPLQRNGQDGKVIATRHSNAHPTGYLCLNSGLEKSHALVDDYHRNCSRIV